MTRTLHQFLENLGAVSKCGAVRTVQSDFQAFKTGIYRFGEERNISSLALSCLMMCPTLSPEGFGNTSE